MTPPPPTKMRQATKMFVNNSGLLVLGTLIALVWANLDRESYVRFAQHAALRRQRHRHGVLLRARREGSGRSDGARRRAALAAPRGACRWPRPSAGCSGPALIFVTLTIVFDRPNLERGWAIPTRDRHRVQLPRRAHHLRREASGHSVSAAAGHRRRRTGAADHRGVLSRPGRCG